MIAFVHINKTAGTTLYHILRQSFGADHCDVKLWPRDKKEERETNYRVLCAQDVKRTKWIYWGLKSIAGHRVTSHSDLHEGLKDVRYYTFLRDPLRRCASHFQFINKGRMSQEKFEDWIVKPHYRNVQCRKIAGTDRADAAIEILENRIGFVGLQEQFDESLVLFREWAKPHEIDIRYVPRNVASHSKLKNEVLENPEYLQLLKEANKEDIKLYKYVRDHIWPGQIEKVGFDVGRKVAELREENLKFKSGNEPLSGRLVRDLFYKPLLPLISRGKLYKS